MFYGIQKSMNLKNSSVVSNGKIGLQAHLSTPFRKCFTWIHGTQYPVTKVNSDDVTVITSWWSFFGTFRMSKMNQFSELCLNVFASPPNCTYFSAVS